MTREEFAQLCLSRPGAHRVVQWGGTEVFKVGPKMFALIGLRSGVSLKASPIAFYALTEAGRARPAPYLARAGWVAFDDLSRLDPEDASDLVATAHGLVAATLTRACRRTLGLV